MTEWLARVFASAVVRKVAYMLVAAAAAFLLGHKAHADCPGQTWYQYGDGNTHCSGAGTTAGAALNAFAACESAASNAQCAGNSVSATTASDPMVVGGTWVIHLVFSTSQPQCGAGFSGDDSRTIGQAAPEQCPGPSACALNAGSSFDMEMPGNSAAAAGSSMCGSDSCQYIAGPASTYRTMSTGAMRNKQSAQKVGTGCSIPAPDAAPAPQSIMDQGQPWSDCSSQAGNVACAGQTASGQYCGTYNGDYICVGQSSAGSCVGYPSGGVACVVTNDHPVAPGAPDSGVAGTPAVPTSVVSGPGGQTTNYYSASTVAGSTKGATTTGTGATGSKGGPAKPTTGTGASGDGTGDSTGACVPSAETSCGDTVTGGGMCDAPPSCTGDPVQCAQVNQAWLMRCQNGTDDELAAAVGDPGTIPVDPSGGDFSAAVSTTAGPFSSGEGTCPAPVTFSVLGHVVTFDIWSKLCDFAGLVSGIVLAIGYLVAARILFGGVAGGFEQGG